MTNRKRLMVLPVALYIIPGIAFLIGAPVSERFIQGYGGLMMAGGLLGLGCGFVVAGLGYLLIELLRQRRPRTA